MSKYKINMIHPDGSEEEQDEVFNSEEEAWEYAGYLSGSSELGAEILNSSNPGDYPLNDENKVDFEVFEIDD
jgi:hypothetical protein